MEHSRSFRKIITKHTNLEPKLRVFISYVVIETGNDGDGSVQRLTNLLAALRIEAYVAEDKLKGGADFPEEIGKSIKICDAFLAILSPSYGTRKWCKRELNMADQFGKVIIPILHSGPYPPKEEGLHLTISQLQFVDFTKVGDNPKSDVALQQAVKCLEIALYERVPSTNSARTWSTGCKTGRLERNCQSKTRNFQCKIEFTEVDGQTHLARGEFEELSDVFSRVNLFFKRDVEDIDIKYKDNDGELMGIDCTRDFQFYKCQCLKSGEVGKIYMQEHKASTNDAAWRSMVRIAVMGQGAVGKTALVLRFLKGHFEEEYAPTIEDSYRFAKRWKAKDFTGHAFSNEKQIWGCSVIDTAGQEDFATLRSAWFRKNNGFIFVFDVTNIGSLSTITEDFLMELKREKALEGEDVCPPVIIVGNKIDEYNLNKSKYSPTLEAGRAFAESKGFPFFEVSAKDNINVHLCFERIVGMVKATLSCDDSSEQPSKCAICSVL